MSAPHSRVVTACLVLVLLGSTVGAAAPTRSRPTAGGPSARTATSTPRAVSGSYAATDSPTVRAHYTFSENADPGVVTVRVAFDVPSNVVSLQIRPPEFDADRLEIVSGDGFSEASDGTHWKWDEHTDGASVTMRYAVNQSDSVFDGLNYVDTGDWALFAPPALAVRWHYTGTSPAYDRTMAVADDATGYVTPGMIYLGQYETREGTRNGQRFTLVVPAAARSSNASTNATAVFDTLGTASRMLDVGGKNRRVVVFRGPDPLRGGGLESSATGSANDTGPDSFWVHTDAPPNSSVYFSEYVHTRQAFSVTDRMEWITEAEDGYYSSLIGLYRGTRPYWAFYTDVSTEEDANRTLAPADRTAPRLAVDYTKGARVLAALDLQIRNATGRNRSFEDVWRRMNDHDGTVSYADFRDIVADVAGRRLDDWLDRYLTTDAVPPVPDDQSLYAPLRSGIDSDRDGLDTAAELDNGTKPFTADTDGDGVVDGVEVREGTDPLTAPTTTAATETADSGVTTRASATTLDAFGAGDSTATASGTLTTAPEGGRGGAAGGDGPDPGPAEAWVILALVALSGVGFVGALGVGAARALDRTAGVGPRVLVERSMLRLAGLAVAAALALVGYVTLVL